MPVAVQTRSRQVAYWTGAGPFPRPPPDTRRGLSRSRGTPDLEQVELIVRNQRGAWHSDQPGQPEL
jgi:hypothetical protein